MGTEHEHCEDRVRLRWFIIPLLLFTLVGLFIAYRQFLSARVNARLAKIRDAGYPATLAELDAWYTIPAGVPNAADIYTKAFALLVWDEQLTCGLPVVDIDTDLLTPEDAVSEPMKEAIRRLLDANREALDLIAEGANVKRCRYPGNLSQGYDMDFLPRPGDIRLACRLLLLQAIVCAEDGHGDLAVRSVIDSLQLSQSLEDEPIWSAQIMRLTCGSIGVAAIEHILSRTTVSNELAVSLRRCLADAGSHRGLFRFLVGARAMSASLFRMKPQELSLLIGRTDVNAFVCHLYQASGLADIDALTCMDLWEQVLDMERVPTMLWLQETDAMELRAAGEIYAYDDFLARVAFGNISYCFRGELCRKAQVMLAETGVAVEQFRLRYWRTPEFLDELVPEFLDAVPVDPFDGAPVRFRRLERGYIIYSVGENGIDDGGTASPRGDDVTFRVAR